MYTRKKIALMIEHKLGYTNGWRVGDETYENECLMVADEIIKLFSIPVVSKSLPSDIEIGKAMSELSHIADKEAER